MKFMDENFLLTTKTAQKLYYNYAANQPIYDYHCHLSPKEIYEDKEYKNITEIWLYGDHYKWRFMRSMGVSEDLCTGDASDYEKFLAYAKCIQYAIGNPLYHWTHLELKRFFGIEECLSEKTAPKIWEEVNKKIAGGDFTARKLITRSNVILIATTDDPADTLEYHKKLKEDKWFMTKVVPTFRPDNAVNIEKTDYCQYIEKLSKAYGHQIASFDDLKKALSAMMDKFGELGCKISDHAVVYMPYVYTDDNEADKVFKNALSGRITDEKSAEIFKTRLLLFLGEQYAIRGWVMQLHIAALRNNNTKMFYKLGPDTGFDSIADEKIAEKLSKFMDALDQKDLLPKTILYTLNPKDNYVLATMLGNFQGGGIKGKIQFGSGWWFNDQIDGMKAQMKALANLGALSAFVGMLTDSRSFLSYPRHEYFRRILCSVLGEWVENGEYPEDYEALSKIVKDICFLNAVEYFDMGGEEYLGEKEYVDLWR